MPESPLHHFVTRAQPECRNRHLTKYGEKLKSINSSLRKNMFTIVTHMNQRVFLNILALVGGKFVFSDFGYGAVKSSTTKIFVLTFECFLVFFPKI